jgi:hypothetical protein
MTPDTLLDSLCNYLARHPRITTAILVALILNAHWFEVPL